MGFRKLRFSPVIKQMDPREENEAYNMYAISGDVDREKEFFRKKEYRVAKDLRSKIKIACFSLDSENDVHENAYSKGWANMKMWEDYGNRYKGACLVFDIQEFIMEIKSQISNCELKHNRINYTNEIIDEGYWIPNITEENQDICVSKDKFYSDDYLFRKPECYISENEYRFLLMKTGISKKASIYIDYGSSLKTVVLGFGFPSDKIEEIKKNSKGVPLFQMRMHWGIPELVEV